MEIVQNRKSSDLESVKNCIRSNIENASRSFVAIGYYLKDVRNRKLYEQDGYENVWEFAQGEFGISKSNASRFMNINDRFSEDGNSPVLREEYKKFSSSKLSEMLTLTDNQCKQITENTTIKEIRQMKEEDKQQNEASQIPETQIQGQIHIDDIPECKPVKKEIDWIAKYCKMNVPKELFDLILEDEEKFSTYFEREMIQTATGCDSYYGNFLSYESEKQSGITFTFNKNANRHYTWYELKKAIVSRIKAHDIIATNLIANEEQKKIINDIKNGLPENTVAMSQQTDNKEAFVNVTEEDMVRFSILESSKLEEVRKILSMKEGDIAVHEIRGLLHDFKTYKNNVGNWHFEYVGFAYQINGRKRKHVSYPNYVSIIRKFVSSTECTEQQKESIDNETKESVDSINNNVIIEGTYQEITVEEKQEPIIDVNQKQIPDKWYYYIPLGKKDCDGIEFHEGDLIEIHEKIEGKFQIYWEPRSVSFIACRTDTMYTDILITLPDTMWEKAKIIGNVHNDKTLLDSYIYNVEKKAEQPELPKLSNNEKRSEWIENFESWTVGIDIKETGYKYYRYDLNDSQSIVVEVKKIHKWIRGGYSKDAVYSEPVFYLLGNTKKNDYTPRNPTFHECRLNKTGVIEFLKEYQK